MYSMYAWEYMLYVVLTLETVERRYKHVAVIHQVPTPPLPDRLGDICTAISIYDVQLHRYTDKKQRYGSVHLPR